MVVAALEGTDMAAVVPPDHHQQHQHNDLPAPMIDPDQVHESGAVSLICHRLKAGELNSASPNASSGGDRAVLVPPTRHGLDSSPALFLWESRTTNVDVMSVSNTTRPVVVSASSRNSERRRVQVVLPYGVGSAANTGVAANGGGQRGGGPKSRVGGGRGGESDMMMGLLDPPNSTALEARLNEDRRVKRCRDLRRERQLFLSRLTQEREERVLLEVWAASRIQATFRGFLVRPRPPRLHPREKLTSAESNRRLVADLQAILSRAGLPMIPGLGPDGRKVPEGMAWGQSRRAATVGGGRSTAGGAGGRGSGLRRPLSRKQRVFEDEMSTRITKVVRGFLERRRFVRRWAVWDRRRRWSSAYQIQNAWRAYRKRMSWRELECEVMDRAAAKIQARWRGMACRMAVARKATEDAIEKRKNVSAVTIQAAARRRVATARYGPSLTLRAARREREARAAAEAARPRRRWNRRVTGTASPGGAAAVGTIVLAATGKRASVWQPEGGDRTGHRRVESRESTSGLDDRNAGSRGKGATIPAVKPSPQTGGVKSSGSPARTVKSPSKELEKQQQQHAKEPAHAWEPGSSNSKGQKHPAGFTPDGDGGGGGSGSNSIAPAASGEINNSGSVDDRGSPSSELQQASREASRRLVRESIEAAVVKAQGGRSARDEGDKLLSASAASAVATIPSTPESPGEEGPMGVAP